jgi:cytochrome oxidase Cu insertion factor (SCO1/SenC/PrrC family)
VIGITAWWQVGIQDSTMKILKLAFLVFGLVVAGRGQEDFPLPPPQIASATGQIAPAFRLKDANSQYVTLASFRGNKVLLMFYRGYW